MLACWPHGTTLVWFVGNGLDRSAAVFTGWVPFLLIFDVIARLVERGARGRALWLERAALDLAVGALEDGEQLLVLSGGAGGRTAACRHGFGGFGGVLL